MESRVNRGPDELPDDTERTDDPLALFETEDAAGADSVRLPDLPIATPPAPVETDRLAVSSPSAPAHTPEPPPPAHVPPAPPSSPMAAGGPIAPEAPSPAGRPIALDTLIARHTPVHWPEAVAVVEAVCAGLLLPDGSTRIAPDLTGIRLHPDGTIGVSDGAPGESSVVRLARTLQALLPARSTPAPLRLMATNGIAATGTQAVAAFANELACFAQPEGQALIRALYERATAAPGRPPAAATAPPLEDTPPARLLPRKRRPPVWLLPAAAALSALAAGGLWYAGQPPAAIRSMAGAAAAVTPGGGAATQASGAGPASPVETPSESAPPPANPRDIQLRPPGAAGGRAPAQAGSTSATTSRPSPPPQVTPPGMSFVPVPPPAPPPVAGQGTGAGPPPVVDGSRIYTSRDPDVIPPSLVYPQLPAPPDRPDPTVAINTMEVVVGEDGRVQTVQLVSTPQRMNDMMLLSAAKVWRFAPASLDGEPVRYRMRVSWATTP